MNVAPLQTARLTLHPYAPEELRAHIAAMAPANLAEVSRDWLAQLRAATEPDPWTFGFKLVDHRGVSVGTASFKGPPSAEGMVEIAYGIEIEYQGKGFATEAAQALVAYALDSGRVRTIRAHTFARENASARVLTKCGFRLLGEVTEPEDGLVWRWERS